MRITKDPEVRKQEILDTAIKLFVSKGYEKTSISDIANAMGVSQGLCYRYFASKEEIYEAALYQYSYFLMHRALDAYDYEGKPLLEQIRMMSGSMGGYAEAEKERPELYELFHQSGHHELHDQLFLRISQMLVPVMIPPLLAAKNKGEIAITDVETAAYFFVYGQIGVLRRTDISEEEKAARIQNLLIELLGLKE